MRDLSLDARERAERSWRQNKAPMAVYWKAISVYAGHCHRLTRPSKGELAGEHAVTARSKVGVPGSSSTGEGQ